MLTTWQDSIRRSWEERDRRERAYDEIILQCAYLFCSNVGLSLLTCHAVIGVQTRSWRNMLRCSRSEIQVYSTLPRRTPPLPQHQRTAAVMPAQPPLQVGHQPQQLVALMPT